MVEEVKTFKVFIASPRDCESERLIVRDIVKHFDTIYFESHKIRISLLGWEDTIAPGGNRPQSEINKDVDECDLFVLCMYKRWGTKPGKSRYTSGSEEEFYRAWERFEKTGSPWIYTFFGIVSEEFLADPGEQLMKVIKFKDKMKSGNESFSGNIFYKEYYLPEDASEDYHNFEKLINRALAKWIGNMLDGGSCAFVGRPDNGVPPDELNSKLAETEKAFEEASKKIEELEKKQKLTVSENAKKRAIELALIGRDLAKKGYLSEAETLFVKAMETYPEEPGILLEYGNLLFYMGRFEAAIETYDKAIKLKPDLAEAYNNKAVALRNLRKYDEAVKAYDKAIELEPDYADAYYNKGIALVNLEKYDEAVKAYDKAIELKPDYAVAYNNKGTALGKLEKYEEAIKAYDKAIELETDYADAYYNKGVALGNLGKYDEEIKAYDKAIELKPDDADAYNNKGITLGNLEKYEEAIKAYDKAIELNPDYANAYFNRACTYSLWGKKDKMLSDLRKAIELDEELREKAKTDDDLDPYRDDPDFRRLVYPEDLKEGAESE